MGGEDLNAGKAIGVANELTVKASGELDNGYTWSYAVDLDEASNLNDDIYQLLELLTVQSVSSLLKVDYLQSMQTFQVH